MSSFWVSVNEWLPAIALIVAYVLAVVCCRKKGWSQAERFAAGAMIAGPVAAAVFVSLAPRETDSLIGAAGIGAFSGIMWACVWSAR